ncbi:MAG: molybdate ABC transporter substrate-binding protein [Phycisphaerales bacterium JB039]
MARTPRSTSLATALTLVGLGLALCACARLEYPQSDDWRWPVAEPPPPEAPLDAERHLRIFAAPEFRDLLRRLERRYEAAAPGVDVQLVFDADLAARSAEENLLRRINAGVPCDLLITESALRILELTRPPAAWAPLAAGQIVAVAPAPASWTEADLLEGLAPVAMALERSGLGRASRLALRRAGAWSTVVAQVGRFDDADAVLEYVAYNGALTPPTDIIGMVWRTSALRAIRAEPDPRRRLRIIAALPSPADEPPLHAVAIWTDAGRAMADWLRGPEAQAEMIRLGFTPIAPETPGAHWRSAISLDDALLRPGAR